MTLQQLRYLIEVASCGSISTAASNLFVSQPTLSKAMADLEHEMGITMLHPTNRGVVLTEDGHKFLAYARQVVEQADLLEEQYKGKAPSRRIFAVSAQHYAFVVSAFVKLLREYDADRYEFSLRESRTQDIIDDMRLRRSEIGVLYLSHFNRDVMLRIIQNAGLAFEPLFTAAPHVFVSRDNPLASKPSVTMDDLHPYPRLTYEQGLNNSFYYAEELHIVEESPKNIVVTDRHTLFNLITGLQGYTISSGFISGDMNDEDIVAVPLQSDEEMQLGYVYQPEIPLSSLGQRYLQLLSEELEGQRAN